MLPKLKIIGFLLLLGVLFCYVPTSSASQVVDIQHIEKVDTRQVDCLTKAIYWEVRKPMQYEMDMVASVIVTRMNTPEYPNTACGVVLERGQFEYVSRGLHDDKKVIRMANKDPIEMKALMLANNTAKAFLSGAKKPITKSIAYISNKIKKPRSSFWNKLKLDTRTELHSFYMAHK